MRDINGLQTSIMLFVKEWVNTQNTPVPQKVIIEHMTKKKIKSFTAISAIKGLLTKGYMRRAYSPQANRTLYVMTRNI